MCAYVFICTHVHVSKNKVNLSPPPRLDLLAIHCGQGGAHEAPPLLEALLVINSC